MQQGGKRWKNEVSPPPIGYFNLTCPFEWSKYSCAYMARGPKAAEIVNASTKHYLHHMEFIQKAFDKISKEKRPRRILFTGDSLLRQLFISIGCNAATLKTNLIDHAEIPWKAEWPCNPNAPCFINHGEHGGFDAASIRLVNGMELHYVSHGGFADDITAEPDILTRFEREMAEFGKITFGEKTAMPPGGPDVDVLVYNVGIHGGPWILKKNMKNFADRIARPLIEQEEEALYNVGTEGFPTGEDYTRTKTIYVTTPTQHYNTHDGQWQYHMKMEEKVCIDSVPTNPKADLEKEILTPGVNVDVLLDYDDLELGRLHVQKGSDCSHYCMPGAPDVVGARLMEAILAY